MPPEATDFPDDILTPMKAAGWFPGRRVSIEHWVSALEAEGLQAFSAARAYLETFGGLSFISIPSKSRSFNPGTTRLDPVLAAAGEGDRIQDWESEHDVKLFPVGNAFDEYYILMITPEEAFYAGSYDGELAIVGHSVVDTFRQLLYAPLKLEHLE